MNGQSEAREEGDPRDTVQGDGERLLRRAGIRLLSAHEAADNLEHAGVLWIRVKATPSQVPEQTAICINIELYQLAVVRDGNVLLPVFAPMWQAHSEKAVMPGDVLQESRQAMAGLIEPFIHAYLTANDRRAKGSWLPTTEALN